MLFVDIWKGVFITTITVISLISNAGLIPILTRSREIQEDAATPLLVALCLSDFLQGVTFGIISSVLSWSSATMSSVSIGVAQFHTFSLLHTRLASLNLVASLSVVKMVTIIKPLRAVDILSKKRIWIILVTCCVVPFTVSLAAFIEPVGYSSKFKDSYFSKRGIIEEFIAAQVFISLFIFIISYVVIFTCVVKQYFNMRKLVIPTGQTGNDGTISNPIIAAFKSAKGIIALCSVYFILHIIGLILTRLKVGGSAEARFVIYRLYDCNGFINVFTYIAFSKPAKKQLKKMIRYCTGINIQDAENTSNVGTAAHANRHTASEDK